MDSFEPRRLILFIVVSVVLLGSAVVFARGGSDAEPPPSEAKGAAAVSTDVPKWAKRTEERVQRSAAELRLSAERFLEAFAHYEVGELSAKVRTELLETTTPGFGRELLEAPPAPPPLGGFVGASHVARLDVRFVSASGLQALASGDLQRGATPEEFGFLFVRRGDRWLASGPGQ